MLTADYERLGLIAGETVLDLGCGFGRHAYEALRRGAHVVACDLGLDELRQVRSIGDVMRADGELSDDVVLETTNGDATMLPFADDSFDRIIASEVMEHIDDDAGALAELTRVLRPGGVLAVTIPARLPEQICWATTTPPISPAATCGSTATVRCGPRWPPRASSRSTSTESTLYTVPTGGCGARWGRTGPSPKADWCRSTTGS